MITRTPFNRFITGLLCSLIWFSCLDDGTVWGQSVSQTRLYPADAREFGCAMASSGNTLFVGDAYWESNLTGSVTGAASVFTQSNGQLAEQSELTASDGQSYDLFGTSVAVSGNMAVVGAPFHNGTGAVYVYTESGGVWSQSQEITPADGAPGDFFGGAVAISANTLAVGAYRKNGSAGQVYLYTLKKGVETLQTTLTTSASGAVPLTFGFSLALSGSSLLVGAPGQNSGDGAAYMYALIGGHWKMQTQLTPGAAGSTGMAGQAVALNGNMAAVGSPAISAVAIYQHGTSGGWKLQTSLSPFEGPGIAGFGAALAMTANTLVVSAVNTDDRECYLFRLQQNTWTPYSELYPFDPDLNEGFGTAVAIVGSLITVSRPYAVAHPIVPESPVGMVYVFSFGPEATPTSGVGGDSFGYAVAAYGTMVICGAPGHNSGAGAVYVYTLSSGDLSQSAVLSAQKGQPYDAFGTSLAYNGTTLAIGAPQATGGKGAVYLYTLTSGAWTLQAKLAAKDGAAGDLFGVALSFSGSTLAVGAPGGNGGSGAVYVFALNAGAWSQTAKLKAHDGQAGDGFGAAVGLDGSNLVIGSPNATTTVDVSAGAVYLFTLSRGHWMAAAKLIAPDGQLGDAYGAAVAISGFQLAIGAPDHAALTGAVYSYVQGAGGWIQQQEMFDSDWFTTSNQFGAALALEGSSLVVGAPSLDPFTGAAFVYSLSGAGWTFASGLYSADGQPFDNFGAAVALSGSVIAVGAPNGNSGAGSLYSN